MGHKNCPTQTSQLPFFLSVLFLSFFVSTRRLPLSCFSFSQAFPVCVLCLFSSFVLWLQDFSCNVSTFICVFVRRVLSRVLWLALWLLFIRYLCFIFAFSFCFTWHPLPVFVAPPLTLRSASLSFLYFSAFFSFLNFSSFCLSCLCSSLSFSVFVVRPLLSQGWTENQIGVCSLYLSGRGQGQLFFSVVLVQFSFSNQGQAWARVSLLFTRVRVRVSNRDGVRVKIMRQGLILSLNL